MTRPSSQSTSPPAKLLWTDAITSAIENAFHYDKSEARKGKCIVCGGPVFYSRMLNGMPFHMDGPEEAADGYLEDGGCRRGVRLFWSSP